MPLNQIDGLPIIDSKKSIKITITKNDIDKADKKEPNDCAVARACRRELKIKEARIHLGRVYLRANEGNWVRYMTLPPLRAEIIAFDRGGTFAAGEYTLKSIPPSHKLGKKTGKKSKRSTTGAKKRNGKTPHVVMDVRSGVA